MSYAPPAPAVFLSKLAASRCCPATTTGELFELALRSRPAVLLILRADGLTLGRVIDRVHESGKLVAIHLDLVSGFQVGPGGARVAREGWGRRGRELPWSS